MSGIAYSPMDRMIAVRTVSALLNTGTPLPVACARAQVSRASYDRWSARLQERGDLRSDFHRCGRDPKFVLTQRETAALRKLSLEKESMRLAIELFASSPECRPETREQIFAILDHAAAVRRVPAWPRSIMRAAHVTKAERAAFRGPKASTGEEMVTRRDMTIIDESGRRLPMLPNMIWESDDMSANEPFSYMDADLGRVTTGRQVLCTVDVFSAAWLAASPLGRQKDAYRVEDIMDHMADTVAQHGLPQIWRLERGAWENNAIDGIPLKQPAPTGVERWGGLGEIIKIVRSWKSKQKGTVEVGFDFLQSLMAHQSESIGRYRGEFENATRLNRLANAGDISSAGAFWGIAECADGFASAMAVANARAKERRSFGRDVVTPDDLRATAIATPCPDEELWRFLPVKREAVVRGGHVEFSVPHYPLPFSFRVNGEVNGLHLDNGYRVLVAFHPGRPDEGCHIFNGEIGTRNRENFRFGESLLLAPMAADAPQVNLSREGKELTARKKAGAAVRSSFRSIVGTGRRATRSETARDGYGDRSEIISRGAGSPDSSTAAPRGANGVTTCPSGKPSRESRPPTPEPDFDEIDRMEREAFRRGDLIHT